MRGIDISNWQDGLNLNSLNIDFAIMKATEGNYFVDSTCDNFVQKAIDRNLLWGFYHFANTNSPEEEAKFFYDNCKNYFNHGIPVLDYEITNVNNVDWCERFLKKLHDLSGVWAILYISASRCGEYENSWIPETCGLWVAGYPMNYTNWISEYSKMPYNIYPWKFAAIWQFTSSLHLIGFSDNLDGDIAYMDKTAWMKYANSTDNPQNVEKPKDSEKSVDDYAREVILGEYGTGDDRKRLLGNMYEKVQNRVNKLYRIADEVIDGKWGNGWNREQSLNNAGYPYDIVQKIVNEKLA